MSRVVNRFGTAESLAKSAAEEFVTKVADLLAAKPVINVMLTGGTIGIATLAAIAEREDAHLLEWSRVHIWWGDERFVDSDSDDRNAKQAKKAWLDSLQIPAVNIHEFPSNANSLTLDEAARVFDLEFAKSSIKFDLMLMGMGPDGHVASLFPGQEALAGHDHVIAVHDSPKPPPERLSFTYQTINQARQIWFTVAGADKAEAVSVVFGDTPSDLPAGRISGKEKTVWYVDQTAGNLVWGC